MDVVKVGARRYGGMLEVKQPFPESFDFQLVDIQIVDDPQEHLRKYETKTFTSSAFTDQIEGADIFSGMNQTSTNPATACMFGRTEEGYSVTVRVPYRPYVYVNLPWYCSSRSKQGAIVEFLAKRLGLTPSDLRISLSTRARLYGYVPDKKDPRQPQKLLLMKIGVPNLATFKSLNDVLRTRGGLDIEGFNRNLYLRPWETRVDHTTKFCDELNLVASGWVHVKAYKKPSGYVSHTQIECVTAPSQLEFVDRPDLAPLLVASVDGEAYSRRYHFPDAEQKEDYLITIGTTLWRVGARKRVPKTSKELKREEGERQAKLASKPDLKLPPIDPTKEVCDTERYAFCLKETDDVPDATIFWYDTEQELLAGWRDFITVHADPDLVLGYNIWGFDWKYFSDRAKEVWRSNKDQVIVNRPAFVEDGADLGDEELREQEREWLAAQAAAEMKEDEEEEEEEEEEEDGDSNEKISNDDVDIDMEVEEEMEEKDVQTRSGGGFFSESRFFYLSRLWAESCPLDTKTFKSSAYGERKNHHFHMLGRAVIDLHQYVRREHKLRSYTLNNVSKEFLKDTKIDLPYKLMMMYFERGSQKRAMIADYCIKDCDLPIALLDFFCAVPNLIEMSRVTFTPLTHILEKGQQIKVFNQLVMDAHRMGFVMNDKPRVNFGKFVGATVVDPKKGWYTTPIATLDFASLYPSIIRDQNLCFSTYLVDPHDPANAAIPEECINKIRVGNKEHWFVNHMKGVLPTLEERLLKARKAVKKKMKVSTGEQYKMLNGKQLAIKISCNSVFGFTGANNGMYACNAIAESITARGRIMIDETIDAVIALYPEAEVIYGDSVGSHSALLLRHDGQLTIRTVEDLWSEHAPLLASTQKEYVSLEGWETWTEGGWTPIQRIMRHRNDKPLVRVVTHTGVVDVTEDHSLLREDGVEVKPKDIGLGDSLLHAFPDFDMETQKVDPLRLKEAKIQGFFMGDGSAGCYDSKWSKKYSWALNNADAAVIYSLQQLCSEVYPDYKFVVDDTLESSGVFKLTPRGQVKNITVHYCRELYDESRNKKVPDAILSAPLLVRQAFWEGYYLADGDKDVHGYTRCDAKSQVSALSLFTLMRSLGYNCSVNTRKDKPNVFRVTGTRNQQRKAPTRVKKIETVGHAGYVYDLTTSNHHFHAGVGQMIVHNTDSVMVKFDLPGTADGIKEAFRRGDDAAFKVTNHFGEAVELEMEKVYCPYLLFGKKRYAGLMFEEPEKAKKIDTKGIEVVRRDSSPLTNHVFKLLLDKIFHQSDAEGAQILLKEQLQKVVEDKMPFEMFIMSKALKGHYKFPERMCHLNVVRKMRERAPGSEPQVGDRVPYVVVRTKKKTKRLCDKTEDPVYAKKHKVDLDLNYYVEKQLQKPLTKLFEPFTDDTKALFRPALTSLQNRYAGFHPDGLMAYFQPKDCPSPEEELDDWLGDEEKKMEAVPLQSPPTRTKRKRKVAPPKVLTVADMESVNLKPKVKRRRVSPKKAEPEKKTRKRKTTSKSTVSKSTASKKRKKTRRIDTGNNMSLDSFA